MKNGTASSLLAGLLLVACSPEETPESPGSDTLVQLDRMLDVATVETAPAPESARQQRDWQFADPQPEWRTLSSPEIPKLATIATEQIDDGLRLALSSPQQRQTMLFIGGLAIDFDDLRLSDWETVLVRARTSDRLAGITVAHNLGDQQAIPGDFFFFLSTDQAPPVFNDGSEQTYAIPLRAREDEDLETPLESLAVVLGGPDEASIDILSVTLVPRGAAFLEDVGVRALAKSGFTRNTLYAHAPATLSYPVEVPSGARLDVGLAADTGDTVSYRVTVTADGGEPQELFAETISDSSIWQQRSVDLSEFAGSRVVLGLEAESERQGAVALWGAPILSAAVPSELPNVIFYVIDGAGADLMSVYGYDRPTTPYLEELAQEGAVFDWAYSNSTWTQSSTASFMTSLQHSVLGGLRRGIHSTPIPSAATTFAEHMRGGGYQTFSLTSNPNAGRIIGVEKGMDLLWDEGGREKHSISSVELHQRYWNLRDAYPGTPYWVHFQTTDVHEPNEPEPPYAGRIVTPGERQALRMWDGQFFAAAGGAFGQTSVSGFYDLALERTGINRQAYFAVRRGLYDETMMHQDHQLQRLVEKLKANGEWENTLLVIGSDHGHPAGTFARFGRGAFDPQPDPWEGALFDAYATRVPLIMIWPAKIQAGLRFEEAVSMIDVLPTVLDLVGLPQPEIKQGQSLAPLLTGERMRVRPVIFDEFRVDENGEMQGNLEIVDGRWGASLEIGPQDEGADPLLGRHGVPVGGRWGAVHPYFESAPRLLLYDLEADPFAREAVNDEYPELVEQYREELLEHWQAHQALSTRFAEAGDVTLSPEQLDQLRSLGYIQ